MKLLNLIKTFFQYQLPPELEDEFQHRTYEWINNSFKIGLPLLSIGMWIFYFWFRQYQNASTLLPFAIGAQIFIFFGIFSVYTKGRLRRLVSLMTPVYPMAYVGTLMNYHVPTLPDTNLMIQAQGWLLWVVMLTYAVERISPALAAVTTLSTTVTFLYFRSKISMLAGVETYQLISQLFAAHIFGLFLCTDNCRRARQEFKLNKEVEVQRKISEDLLRNVLPKAVVDELKQGTVTIAHNYKNVSVLFADLVDFTKKATLMESSVLVKVLDELFSRFDQLADKHGIEKIKTIGDAYMAVAGCPESDEKHALKIAHFALEMDDVLAKFNRDLNLNFKIKIGISSGSVIGGVIGKKRIAFDLWGDVVNLASRLESVAGSGNILISETTAGLIKDEFPLSPLKIIELKGKGPTPVYQLFKQRSPSEINGITESKPERRIAEKQKIA